MPLKQKEYQVSALTDIWTGGADRKSYDFRCLTAQASLKLNDVTDEIKIIVLVNWVCYGNSCHYNIGRVAAHALYNQTIRDFYQPPTGTTEPDASPRVVGSEKSL
jgi:hypothetical protein